MKAAKFLLTLLLTIIISFPALAQVTIYVSPNGTGNGTVNDPTDLQTALTTAQTDGSENVILMLAGTYQPSSAYLYDTANCDNKDVYILGGWEQGFGAQGPAPTILDGNNTSQIMTIFAMRADLDYTIRLDNLTFLNGKSPALEGGALHVTNGTVAGGGDIYLEIVRVTFRSNKTLNYRNGGALYLNTDAVISRCIFEENDGGSGGAIYINLKPGAKKPEVEIYNTNFSANTNSGWQGNTILNNGDLLMVGCLVKGKGSGTTSGDGATVYNGPNTEIYVDRCIFRDNIVTYWGSAIDLWNANGTIINSLFFNNKAGGSGSTSGYGTITYYHDNNSENRNVIVTNNTFADNLSQVAVSNGSAVVYRGNGGDTLWAYNNIFANEPGEGGYPLYNMDYFSGGMVMAGNNLFTKSELTSAHLIDDGGNLLSADPGFSTGAMDYHIVAGSAAINAGRNDAPGITDFDLDNGLRVLDGTVDIGAYEYNRAPTDMDLSPITIDENVPIGTQVGTFTTNDPDAEDQFIYYLTTGNGTNDQDNYRFEIDGNQLQTIEEIDYEEDHSLNIHVRVEDAGGLSYTESFVITVNDMNEAPIANDTIPDFTIDLYQYWTYSFIVDLFTDVDQADQLTLTAELAEGGGLPGWMSFTPGTRTFEATPTASGTFHIVVTATDLGGLNTNTDFYLTVLPGSGIHDISTKPAVYPNPTNGVLMVNWEVPLSTDQALQIFSMDGRMVWQEIVIAGTTQITFNLQQLANGLYWLKGDGYVVKVEKQ